MLINLKSVIFVFFCLHVTFGADYSIQMSKIKVLTLNHGEMTNSRRVPAVPQLKCVGGTAGCRAFIPQVVQCENKGSDGITIQWECKTDMDNAYRFGKITVICEGYDYPGDQYVLVGSCGLEYNIDVTKEGIDNHPRIPIIDIGPPPTDFSIQMSKIKVLTLNHGKMTNSRRVPAVPQLKCVGGTAGCRAFIPQVVQCENKGSDGITIQWECKTDMDNAYRFGKITVICEGYDYPGDQYVLVGSCGLEYNIDVTKEGIDNHPRIPIIDIGPPPIERPPIERPPTNQGTSTELSSLTIFLICLGVLLFVTAIFALIACIVWSERSSSYDVHSRLYNDFDVPIARPVPYTVYRPTTVFVSNDRKSTAGNRVASSSGTRTASGFGGTMSR